jgi:hypothetical protein
MRTTATSRRPGFSLIEVAAVMAGLGVAVGLLTTVLWGAIRLEKVSAASLQAISSRQGLADQFRLDVALTREAPERWKDDVAGPGCLLLRMDADRLVVYRCEGERLIRSEVSARAVQKRELGLGPGRTVVEFRRTGPGGRLLTLRLATPRPGGQKGRPLDITAALGGDLE